MENLGDVWIIICEFLNAYELARLGQVAQSFYKLTKLSSVWEASCRRWAINLPDMDHWAESWENDRTESAFPLNNANHSPKWGSCYSPRNESYNNENSPSDHPQFSSSSLSSFITSPRFKMIWKARYQSLTSSACICTNSSFGSDEINIDNTHGIFSKLGSDTNTEQDDMDVRGIDLISYIWPCRQPPEAPGSEIATSHSCDVANIDPSRRIARRHKSAMISTAQQNDQRLLQATRSQSAEHSLKSFAMPFHPRRTLESLSTFDLSPAAFLDIRSVNWRELWLTTLLDSPEVFKVSSDRFIWKVAILDLIERRKITLERKLHFPDISTQKKSESKCPECESVSSDVERDSTMNKDDVVVMFKVGFSASHQSDDDWNLEFWAHKKKPSGSPFGGFRVRLLAQPINYQQICRQGHPMSDIVTENDPAERCGLASSTGRNISQLEYIRNIHRCIPCSKILGEQNQHSENDFLNQTLRVDGTLCEDRSIRMNVKPFSYEGCNRSHPGPCNADDPMGENIDHEHIDDNDINHSINGVEKTHQPIDVVTQVYKQPEIYLPLIPKCFIQQPSRDICRSVWKLDGEEWGWESFLLGQNSFLSHIINGYLFFEIEWLHRRVQIDNCMLSGFCSFRVTGPSHVVQPWYNCFTCGLDNSVNPPQGCCAACAAICHRNHDVRFQSVTVCYCDCGAGSNFDNGFRN